MENIVATVTVDERGRYLHINGEDYDIYEMTYEKYPNINPEEEDEWCLATIKVEDELLKRLGVTHMVSPEDFGTEEPQPISELLARGGDARNNIKKNA